MSMDLPPELKDRAEALDEGQRDAIEKRAYALWEEAGRPEGRALDYWILAEQEIVNQSSAGEEDPLAALDAFEPGALDNSAER